LQFNDDNRINVFSLFTNKLFRHAGITGNSAGLIQKVEK